MYSTSENQPKIDFQHNELVRQPVWDGAPPTAEITFVFFCILSFEMPVRLGGRDATLRQTGGCSPYVAG